MTEGRPQYVESELRHPAALRFASPNAAALSALREQVTAMPVRPRRVDPTDFDRWEERDTIGPIDAVMARVQSLLQADFAETQRTLGGVANWEIVFTDSNLRPDALHVLVVLSPTARDKGTIIYGARIQRVGDGTFVLWSDM